MTEPETCPYCGSDIDDSEIFSCYTSYKYVGGEMLYERTFTCYERQIAQLIAENERLKKCYESATGKPVCGEGSIIRMECRQMTALRDWRERARAVLQKVPHFLADEVEGMDREIDALLDKKEGM